jgi:hypothetical protein
MFQSFLICQIRHLCCTHKFKSQQALLEEKNNGPKLNIFVNFFTINLHHDSSFFYNFLLHAFKIVKFKHTVFDKPIEPVQASFLDFPKNPTDFSNPFQVTFFVRTIVYNVRAGHHI